MPITVKFTVTDENYIKLCKDANDQELSIQDYIRRKLFDEYNLFSPIGAINKALLNYSKGDTFTVPELLGEDWKLPNGTAGKFGAIFSQLIKSEYITKIRFTGIFKKNLAIYEIL